VLAGFFATLVADTWLGIVEGDWLVNAGAFALIFLAIAAAMAGLYSLFGKAGLGIGALLMIFVGNPFSAAATAPELLPQPVGGLGQLMPPGAGANLLRSTGFFDGAGSAEHVAVLAVWAGLGLAAMLLTRAAHQPLSNDFVTEPRPLGSGCGRFNRPGSLTARGRRRSVAGALRSPARRYRWRRRRQGSGGEAFPGWKL